LKQPVLGICLYAIDVQQISGREYQRIGNFDVDVIKFTSKVKVPQMAGIIYKLKSDLF
jgi:glutamine amidotransferase